ncbi:N-acylglucosamine-6-phosphate 2-epimerase [Erwinia toletana]|uniref:Putative N-acetylmannosamine-6-phosphate 2-epimerase n=1 Tax=Winslowiella toletana TaxID=92490 RepID=A0ABS4PAP0_9GAMM|nr:putative N-acetylmannosamine-6-phosphate 2-epimerase [Winslowiella toletana]MBP2169716.1 N-acylglucosamine-6-phosphate 2-epimerase [Winslowiella toletana]
MSSVASLKKRFHHGLIVSCQPVAGSPMDNPQLVAAMAAAAVQGGAVALRIEGIDNLRAVRQVTDVPVIGIIKRDLPDTPIRITPWLSDIDQLSAAGADIIAFDATWRARPCSVKALYQRVRDNQRLTMADCATFDEGIAAQQMGIDFIGTTLSGYTGGEIPALPDIALVSDLAQAGACVIAEGRYNAPDLAAAAISAGALAVTVGSAITRIEHICGWFTAAIQQA